jgi:hypothetical protein
MDGLSEQGVSNRLAYEFCEKSGTSGDSQTINTQSLQTIKIQLLALQLIETRYLKATTGAYATFWYLSTEGRSLMFDMRAVRKKTESVP